MPSSPKTRWRNHPLTRMVSPEEQAQAPTLRMDAEYFLAKDILLKLLAELRYNTQPTIEVFMENIDFMLDHPALIDQAKRNLEAVQKEAKAKN